MCPVYGISMFVIFNVLSDYSLQPFWQVIGAIGIVTVIEYVTGALLRKITGRRFWDYRDMPYNLDGYIVSDIPLSGECWQPVGIVACAACDLYSASHFAEAGS